MHFSVRGKLFAGFSLALAATVVVSVLAISRLAAVNNEASTIG